MNTKTCTVTWTTSLLKCRNNIKDICIYTWKSIRLISLWFHSYLSTYLTHPTMQHIHLIIYIEKCLSTIEVFLNEISVSSTCTSGIVSTALILYLWVLLNRCHHRLSVKNKKKIYFNSLFIYWKWIHCNTCIICIVFCNEISMKQPLQFKY